jgi:ABC-type Fe3+ transport system substrate-binding protein
VTIELVYSSEKERWLAPAVKRWQETNPTVNGRPIQVVLKSEGSQAMVTGLKAGALKPTAISPASTLQITQINAATVDAKTNLAADAQPLVYTPLVIVGFKDSPADQLTADAMLWTRIHDLTVEPDRSKKLLFGQTSPELSHSGLQTWILMAYSYHNKTRGLSAADINDPKFQAWIETYARNVEKFDNSTTSFITTMIQFGRSRFNAGTVYESTAIENIRAAQARFSDLSVIYPPDNQWSDHPFAILDASWVTPEQRDAARQLRDFLLAKPQQEAAVRSGFRPSDPDVAINGAGSPFVDFAQYGIKTEIKSLVEDPQAEVTQALLDTWNRLKGNVSQ